VSCASAGNCSAGGYTGGSQAFVINEVNGTWYTLIDVSGIPTDSAVYSVSCSATGRCSAGGRCCPPPAKCRSAPPPGVATTAAVLSTRPASWSRHGTGVLLLAAVLSVRGSRHQLVGGQAEVIARRGGDERARPGEHHLEPAGHLHHRRRVADLQPGILTDHDLGRVGQEITLIVVVGQQVPGHPAVDGSSMDSR